MEWEHVAAATPQRALLRVSALPAALGPEGDGGDGGGGGGGGGGDGGDGDGGGGAGAALLLRVMAGGGWEARLPRERRSGGMATRNPNPNPNPNPSPNPNPNQAGRYGGGGRHVLRRRAQLSL